MGFAGGGAGGVSAVLLLNLHQANSVNKVAGTIFAIIVLQIILQSIIAAVTRHRMKDERDKLIQLRGYRAGYLTLAALMVFGLGMLWLHSMAGRFPDPCGLCGAAFSECVLRDAGDLGHCEDGDADCGVPEGAVMPGLRNTFAS